MAADLVAPYEPTVLSLADQVAQSVLRGVDRIRHARGCVDRSLRRGQLVLEHQRDGAAGKDHR